MATTLLSLVVLCLLCAINALNSRDLFMSYNAAIIRALDNGTIARLERKYPLCDVIDVFTCYPSPDKYQFVPESKATGLLKTVLTIGALRFKSPDGDYTVNPPVGFLPEFMEAILSEFNNYYREKSEKKIVIERIYSQDTLSDLASEVVYMTDIYYYMTSNYKNLPTTYAFQPGCSTFGYESNFITKKEESQDENYDTLMKLKTYIAENSAKTHIIAALSMVDFNSSINVLPQNRLYSLKQCASYDEIVKSVEGKSALTGYTSGKITGSDNVINSFPSNLLSPRSVLFKKITEN